MTAQSQIEGILTALKSNWIMVLLMCICCPLISPFLLIWYAATSCIRPRCYLTFTTCTQITWIWLDEITDILFLYLLHQSDPNVFRHRHDEILYFYGGCVVVNHLINLFLSVMIRNNWCFDKKILNRYQYIHHQVWCVASAMRCHDPCT